MDKAEILKELTFFYHIDFKDIFLLREGGCVSYCVTGEIKKYLMKIIPDTFIETAKHSFQILKYLEEKEFPVPGMIPTKDGGSYVEVNTTEGRVIWVLFEYIDGREPEEGEDIETIGSLVGQLHHIMKEYKGELPVRDKKFFIDRYIDILRKLKYDERKIERFREYGDTLWEKVKNLPRGFCHGDLHRGNLLKTPQGKIYLLDFDTACNAFPIYDIMIMCNTTNYFDYQEEGYEKAKNTYELFLKGYTKYNLLTEEELSDFYDLIAIYHYQLQATIIEIYGLDCVDEEFLDKQLDWLMRWRKRCEITF